jgi:Tol biopolymer transport system component/predicted Ser/Thr protein kinase
MNAGSVPNGTQVGRYEIVSLLRRGGMGEVYTAEDRQLGRRVALKILPKNRTSDPDRVARFVREARASSTLNHPSIVAVYDAGTDGDVHFLAMELIDGQPLSEWMRKSRSLSSRLEVMAQVAEGLAKAHDAGIIHRDLKPDNIMVTREGRAKIVDFGIAKLTERLGERAASTGITTPTSRVGTTAYMSPEQIEGKTLDHRADVFAFGAVLYELLTGTSAFGAEQYADTIHNVVHLDPSLDRIPVALRRIVRRCLRKEVHARYDSLRDVALDLRETIEEEAPARGKSGWLWALLASVVVGAVGAAGAWLWMRSRPADLPPAMTTIRLTNSGKVTGAAISPDGKYLVYAERVGSAETLNVKQIATETVTTIAPASPQMHYTIQVSPDASYAYYTSAPHADPNVVNLHQIPLLGGPPRQIASDTESWFSLSPDGTQVVFRRFNAIERYHTLTVARIDGGGERVVLRRRHPEFVECPVWTPDGKAITFILGNTVARGEGGLYRLEVASGSLSKIEMPKLPSVGSYAWLADGSGALVTAFERDQPPQIWHVAMGSSGSRRKVTSEVSAYYGVTPTADSRSFSVVRDATDSNIYVASLGDDVLQPLTSGIGNRIGGGPGGVRWLGDGEVMFSGGVQGAPTTFTLDMKSKVQRRLIHNLPTWHTVLSPDGRKVAFVTNKNGFNQLWIADRDGSRAVPLTQTGNASNPAFMPDGQSIVFMRFDAQQFAWRVPVDGSRAPVALTSRPTNRPSPSPDGRLLLCRMRSTDGASALWRTAVLPIDGSGTPKFFDVPRHGGHPMLQWKPDGTGFYYVDARDGVANLWMQPLSGEEPRQVTFFPAGEIFSFEVANDGKRVVLSRGESSRDAVLIRDYR